MPPTPLITALVVGAVSTAGVVHLALDPAPYPSDRALLIGLGMSVAGLVVMAGLLVARSRWSRWSALALALAWALLSARDVLDPAGSAILGMSGGLVALCSGPWLRSWLRHRPAADGPPPAVVVLLLTLLAVPTVVGVSSTADVAPLEWLGAVWAVALALGISRAWTSALWAVRLAHTPMMLATAWAAGVPAAIWIAALGIGQGAVAWRREVMLAVSPLLPRPVATTPLPPELVDPEVLHAAGLDDRGRPILDEEEP